MMSCLEILFIAQSVIGTVEKSGNQVTYRQSNTPFVELYNKFNHWCPIKLIMFLAALNQKIKSSGANSFVDINMILYTGA